MYKIRSGISTYHIILVFLFGIFGINGLVFAISVIFFPELEWLNYLSKSLINTVIVAGILSSLISLIILYLIKERRKKSDDRRKRNIPITSPNRRKRHRRKHEG